MSDDMIAMVLDDAREKMAKAVEHARAEFTSVRTGRAAPALVEKLLVDYYGTEVPLQQIAGFTVPEARLLVINPYDKGSLGAVEVEADAMLRGTHSGVDGLYTADPRTDPTATKLDEVSYLDVINRGLKAMDSTAITLCMDNKLPIVVFDLLGKGNIRSIVGGEAIGTLIH
ncbi:MAG TPA: ribosome recycling factor [Acidimicrobiales bacterium]